MAIIDLYDRAIIQATQAGLPLVPQPYQAVADEVGLTSEEVMRRIRRLLALGMIRRIGAVPNHYALGYRANGMSVWDVPDERISVWGRQVGALPFVSHCYHRPRQLPEWPYNLFAMIHGRDRGEVQRGIARIARLLGGDNLGHTVLYSTRLFKKAGLRLRESSSPVALTAVSARMAVNRGE